MPRLTDHRPVRKLALALLAAAGLVASGGWTNGPAPLLGDIAPVPGRAAISTGGHLETAALGQNGAGTLLSHGGERTGHRWAGEGGGRAAAAPAVLAVALLPLPAATTQPASPSSFPSHARAGLEAAPSTGPPSFSV